MAFISVVVQGAVELIVEVTRILVTRSLVLPSLSFIIPVFNQLPYTDFVPEASLDLEVSRHDGARLDLNGY